MMAAPVKITYSALHGSSTGIRDDFFGDLDYCLDAPSQFPSGSARAYEPWGDGFLFDTGYSGARDIADWWFREAA